MGVLVGETITCPACGEQVTATVESYSNLTVLIGSRHCIDGNYRHVWPASSKDGGKT